MTTDAQQTKRVLIIGAGFAGLNVAKSLANKKNITVEIIDRRNHHLFQPLLYQVAMAELSPAEIATPIRSILNQYENISVNFSEVTDIDLSKKQVIASGQNRTYDYLVLACGAQHGYFGNNQWEKHAPGLKSVEQATEIRRRIFTAFELAEKETDENRRKQLLTFVVVGGGPTGVELAGALAEICRYQVAKDYKSVKPEMTRIILIEGSERVLVSFPPKLSGKTERYLKSMGVEVMLNKFVTQIDATGVQIKDERISAHTVVWAAGVLPSKLNAKINSEKDRAGRLVVTGDLSLPHNKDVFVIGDQACFYDDNKKPLPGLAPVATQQGKHVASNILADLKKKPRKPFKYFDKGNMATIGRSKAVCEIFDGRIQFSGFIAWCAWLFIHVLYLVGFRNRIVVLINWAWSYVTFKRGARLIVNKEWRFYD